MNVLVIDDDAAVRRSICACFFGMELREAWNLNMALGAMKETHFDLIIADLILPDSEPMNTIAQIRKADLDSVLVAISGEHPSEDVRHFCDGVILKPLRSCDELASRVMAFIETSKTNPLYVRAVRAISAWAKTFGREPEEKRSGGAFPVILGAHPRGFGQAIVA